MTEIWIPGMGNEELPDPSNPFDMAFFLQREINNTSDIKTRIELARLAVETIADQITEVTDGDAPTLFATSEAVLVDGGGALVARIEDVGIVGRVTQVRYTTYTEGRRKLLLNLQGDSWFPLEDPDRAAELDRLSRTPVDALHYVEYEQIAS